MDNILEVKNLVRSYNTATFRDSKNNVNVLKGISFQVAEGEFVGIMGKSGCGKTTLLKTLGMIDKPTDGTIKFMGEDTSELYGDKLADIRNSKIGFIFQDFYLMDSLSVEENIMLPMIISKQNINKMIAEAKKYAEQFQIEHLLKKNPYELSGGEKQRVAICRALINNPDLMDKLSPDGQKAIAEAMDKSVMTPLASGFIDFELREGFRGNTDGLTSDDISKLREHDPGFGKIIGIDTTKFYTSGPEKNVTIIKLDYEDIKPALSIDQKGFEKENIVPGSIRAYKEFGQSMKVDGMRFGVTNLVTFEEKLKGEDLPYRTTCVMDDSGRVRGFLEVQEPDRRIPMDLQAKLDAAPGTETHFASLDRTDPENRACIPGLRNATPEIREAFFDKVEAKMPEFMEKFCDNMKEDFLERKDALIAKLDEAKQERAIVHIDLNKVELVRENVLSELADARTGMQDIAEDMNDVMLGYYPVNNKINDVDVKLNREDISKEEKESLEKERADYVKEREEIGQKLDDMKPGFVERYNDYLKISERSELPALDRLSETLSESFLNANGRVEALSMYLERIYGADVDDGEGNLSKTRIMDGLEYGTEFHGEPRFQMVCAWEGQKETLPYQGTFKEYLKENPDLFTEIDSRLEKIIDAYNETAPDTDKITIGEDGQPYTKDGILVEAVTTGKHEDFPKNELEKVYNRDMDQIAFRLL